MKLFRILDFDDDGYPSNCRLLRDDDVMEVSNNDSFLLAIVQTQYVSKKNKE